MIQSQSNLGAITNQYITNKGLRSSTADCHKAIARTFTPCFMAKAVSEITADDLVSERDRQLRLGIAQSTVSRRMRTVKAWLNFCAEQGVEISASALAVKTPRGTSKQRAIDPNLVDRVWESYRENPHAALGAWLLAYHLGGMRITDLLLLKPENLKEDRVEYVSSKTSIPCSAKISEPVALLLHRHSTSERLHGMKMTSWNDDSEMRKAIGSATTRINKELKRRGLGCSCHDARRSAAYKLVSSGADVDQVKRICGWRSSEQALYYVRQVDRNDVDHLYGAL